MTKLIATAFLVFVLTAPSLAVASGPEESIVSIWVETEQGTRSFGTGFSISDDGKVLTAYHVVEGARSIRVFLRGQAYSNIFVDAIGPDVDLAVLRINGLPEKEPYLRLVQQPPPAAAQEELKAFGHAAGIRDQVFGTKMTRPPFVKSREFTTRKGPLFTRDDLDLIALNLTIFNGLSGGPLVSSDGALGVISGSLQEGGSIAWAIPAKYAREPYLQPVNQPPSELKWPPLKLMAPGWQTLRSRVVMDERLATAIDRYFDAIEALQAADDRAMRVFEEMISATDLVIAALEGTESSGNTSNPVLELMIDRYMASNQKLDAAMEQWGIAQSNFSSRFVEIHTQLLALPRTSRNVERIGLEDKVLTETARQVESVRSYFKPISAEVLQTVAKAVGVGSDLAKRRALLLEIRGILQKMRSATTRSQLQARLAALRSYGRAVESLLTQPLDDWNSSWTYISANGFILRFPGGWETGARVKSEVRTKITSHALEGGMVLEDIFPNWDGRIPGDEAPNIGLIVTVLPLPGPLSSNDYELLSSGYVEGLRRAGIAIVRKGQRVIAGKMSVVVESAWRTPDGDFAGFDVLVPAGQRTIIFSFQMQRNLIASNWPKCLAVLNGLELN